MATTALVGALRATLGLDTAAFEDGAKRANTVAGRLEKTLKRAFAGISAALLVGGLTAAAKSAINFADNMGKMAQRIGIPVEQLSALDHVAKLADVSLESLGTAVARLSRNMIEVGRGATNEASRAFAELGISVRNADGTIKSANVVLAEMADRFATMPDGAHKTALAMGLLGRSGADLITLLNQGSEAIGTFEDEARRLGLTIDRETAVAAERFNDNLTRLNAVMQGVIQTGVNEFVRALGPLLQQFADFATKSDLASNTGRFFGEVLLGAAQDGMRFSSALTQIGIAIAALNEAFSTSGRDMDIWKQAVADIRAETERLNAAIRATEQQAVRGGSGSGTPWWSRGVPQATQEFELLNTKLDKTKVKFRETYDVISGADLLEKQMRPAIESLSDAFTEFSISASRNFKNVGDAFKSMVADLLEQAARAMLNRAFTSLLGSLLVPAAQPGPGFLHFGGPRQHGGPVAAGAAYMVGERGREMFVPSTSGTVIPNDALEANLQLNIINTVPGVQARERMGPSGRPELVIEETVTRLLNDPRSRVNQSLARRGAGPPTKGR